MHTQTAIFPGSFDPFTVGHESLVTRGLLLFDKIIVAIGYNTSKKGFISPQNRMAMIQEIFAGEPRVDVQLYTGLTVNFCKDNDIKFILRGLRTAADFEYERAIGHMNNLMETNIETVFLLTQPEHSPISSTIVRDILLHGGDVSKFVPNLEILKKYLD